MSRRAALFVGLAIGFVAAFAGVRALGGWAAVKLGRPVEAGQRLGLGLLCIAAAVALTVVR